MKQDFVINVENWRMGDYADFFEAASESKFNRMFELVAKVVSAWPHEGSPSEVESYRNLSVQAWRDTVAAVTGAINANFQQGN